MTSDDQLDDGGWLAEALEQHVRPGSTVAVGDGAGSPVAALHALGTLSRDLGPLTVMLGWVIREIPDLPDGAVLDVRTIMGGYGTRRLMAAGSARYVPVPISTVPALLRNPLRPDVLIATVVRTEGGYRFGTEVSWMPAAIDAGARVLGIVDSAAPFCRSECTIPADRLEIIGEVACGPATVSVPEPSDVHWEIGRRVAALVPRGARIQFGPGQVAHAVVASITEPVLVDSGVISDSVLELDRKGLLLGQPMGTYVVGSGALYSWAQDNVLLERIEVTHSQARLSAEPPLFAVNTALQIDELGQVNVERLGASTVAGIGGHPDYAAAAARSLRGLSIIAVPSVQGRHSTLVERLEWATSTPRHDVDVVVTERGVADLRGLDADSRRASLRALWEA